MKSLFTIGALSALIAFIACNTSTSGTTPETEKHAPADSAALVQKGAYLVGIAGCGDCHNPKVMTPQGPAPEPGRLLSGYNASRPFNGFDPTTVASWRAVLFNMENTAFAGPWGITYAANLTPDATGIGNWTFDQFKTAMTQGKWKGLAESRPLLPPMPWQNYTNMKEEDLSAIFAYLRSLEPVKNLVPPPVSPAGM